MANFRRRRPRISGHSKGYSEVGWRARHNLKPVRVPNRPEIESHTDYAEWSRWWQATRDIFYPDSAPSQMANWPRWHDLLNHTRPTRRKAKEITAAVKRGQLDPDDAAWPLDKKPHIYYW